MGEPGFSFASFQDCLTSAPHTGFNVAKTEYPKLVNANSVAFTSTGFSKITLKYS